MNISGIKKIPLMAALLGAAMDLFALVWTFRPGLSMDPVLLQFRGYSKILLIAGAAGILFSLACYLNFFPIRRDDFFDGKKVIWLGAGLFLSAQTVAVLVQYVHLIRHRDSYTMYQAVKGVLEANGVYMRSMLPVTAGFLGLLALTSLIMLFMSGFKRAIFLTLFWGIILGGAHILGLFMARYGTRFGIFINVPAGAAYLFTGLFVYGLCMLLAAFICIIAAMCFKPSYDGKYVVILGCGLKKDSSVGTNLEKRIRTALAYRDKRREQELDTRLVVSGGQGKDEAVTEAESMVRYLADAGEETDGIIREEASANTVQNLVNSKKLIEECEGGPAKSAFATSGFHLFRSGIIARKAGMDAEGIGCMCPWYDRISLYFRECLALGWQNIKVHIAAAIAMAAFGIMMMLLYRIHTGLII